MEKYNRQLEWVRVDIRRGRLFRVNKWISPYNFRSHLKLNSCKKKLRATSSYAPALILKERELETKALCQRETWSHLILPFEKQNLKVFGGLYTPKPW